MYIRVVSGMGKKGITPDRDGISDRNWTNGTGTIGFDHIQIIPISNPVYIHHLLVWIRGMNYRY